MSLITVETLHQFNGGQVKINVKLAGGSVAIAPLLADGTYGDAETISTGGLYILDVAARQYKFTPAGGAAYQIV